MIAVCTTLTTFAMDRPELWGSWLRNAEALRSRAMDGGEGIEGHEVNFFAAVETDARGPEMFEPLFVRLRELGGEWWTYTLNDGRTAVTTGNRLRHISCGENLTSDWALTQGADWVLFLASDCAPCDDAIPKLLALDHPLVGGHVSTYCLSGPRVDKYPVEWNVQEHMASAAFIMTHRDLYSRLKWRWDGGFSDDPAWHYDALNLFGVPTYVRHDCPGKHYPEAIGGIETRGYDLSVVN